MIKKSKISHLLITAVLINSFTVLPAFSENDLSELSLEELLEIEVSTASKSNEKIQDAPGIISAYSSKTIEELGYYSLSDLANITPGYSSYTKYGEKVFETRGQKADSFNNNKHYLLVDGIPINHARNFKVPIEEELPVFFANQVEFLKGPGSALYGTGAFYGVVNVIPKSLKENGSTVEAKVSAGTMDNNKRAMANALHKDNNGEARISLGYYKKDASRAFVGTKDDENNRFWDDQKSVFLNLSYKRTEGFLDGLSTGLLYMSKNGGLGEHWMESQFTHQINDLTWDIFVPYLKYQKQFTDKWKLNSYLKYNHSVEKGWWAPFTNDSYKKYDGSKNVFAAYDIGVQNFEGLVESDYQIFDWMNLLVGLNGDLRYQMGNPDSYELNISGDAGEPYKPELVTSKSSDLFFIYSAYSQLNSKFPILKDLNVTLGGRADIGQSMGQSQQRYFQASPRVAVVQKLTDNFNVKLLWGNAMRSPGLKEFGLNSLAKRTYGDKIKDITAETINTLEGGITFNNDNINSSLTYFNNTTNNALDGTRFENDNIFVNSSGQVKTQGFEGDIQYYLNRDFKLFANYAFAMAKSFSTDPKDSTKQVESFLNDIPVQKANLGINYTLTAPFHLSSSLIGRWVSDYRVADTKITAPAGNFVLDLNLTSQLTSQIMAEVQVRNILDQKYKLPKNGIPDVPMPGRTFLFTLGYRM